VTVAVQPPEPDCADDRGHRWHAPHELVGGLEENPGVWGHGGGVISKDVCRFCGVVRTVDTWAQDPETGEQGLESYSYEVAS
jgi:hypothetical protein